MKLCFIRRIENNIYSILLFWKTKFLKYTVIFNSKSFHVLNVTELILVPFKNFKTNGIINKDKINVAYYTSLSYSDKIMLRLW